MIPTEPPALPEWTGRRIALATLVVVAVLLAFYLLLRFYAVVFILFVAIVIAVAIRPAVEWLYRHGIPRAFGVLAVYLGLLVLAVGFFVLLTPLLVEQVATISGRAPDYYKTLVGYMLRSPSVLVQGLAFQLPASMNFTPVIPGNESTGLPSVTQIVAYFFSAARTIFIATSILVIAFYWTLDGDRSVRSLLVRVPPAHREVVLDIIGQMEEKVGAYVRGVVILSLTVALMAGVAYVAIGLPYALILGLIAGVLEALPVIGPVLGAVPPVLLALSLEPSKVIWVVLAVIVIQQIEGNLLVPRVMDRAVGVNAIITILAIFAFGALFGLGGAIMAIPLAAVIQVLFNRFVFEPAGAISDHPDGRNRYSILRLQAQELAQDVRKQVRRKEDAAEPEADRVEDLIEELAIDLDGAFARLESPEGVA